MSLEKIESVDGRPMFKMAVGDAEAVICFSDKESDDVKGKVRSILTSAYEERIADLIDTTDRKVGSL